jgi:quinol monooxygenase YgiN
MRSSLRHARLQDARDPHTLYLYEVYRDEAALEAHRQAPHFVQWRETVQDWFDGDPRRASVQHGVRQ